jgi:radical SAM/Cys-rich protein
MSDFWQDTKILKNRFDLIQINIGDMCNLTCHHCHIGASPKGIKNMTKDTALKIIKKLKTLDIDTIEFTGGTPEMNENFLLFIEELSRANKKLVVRTSLTILDDPKYSHFIDIYKKHSIKIIASLPSVFEDNTTQQRGDGVYDTTIKILKKLNDIGYKDSSLKLDLVHNPVGAYLPISQSKLQNQYKQVLNDKYNIHFNALATIVNMPIKRFKTDLKKQNLLDSYMDNLKQNFNINTIDNLMCRNLITIDYRGYIHDCDFNLALDIAVKGYENIPFWDIDFKHFKPQISFKSHCYACTVNSGSSCSGELIDKCDAKENTISCGC